MNPKGTIHTVITLPNQFLTYGQIYLTIQINTFLYYMSKLPVMGKIMNSSWYGRYRLKKIWNLFGLVLGFFRSALANNLGTLVIIYVLPHLFLREEKVTPGVYLMLFLLLKCISGMLMECGLFKTSTEDYTFLNHFMVNPVSYYRYKALKNAFFSSIMLFPALFFLFQDWRIVGTLAACKLFCTLFGNVIYLSFYKRTQRLPDRRIRRLIVFPLILLAYAGAYFGLYQEIVLSGALLPGISIACILLAAACWNYHLHYSDYKKIAVKFANQSAVTFQVTVGSTALQEGEDGIAQSSWEENKAFFNAHKTETLERYLELAFFNRFGKALHKEKRDKMLVMTVICAILGLGIRFGWLPVTSDTALDYSPILIAFATSMAFANRLMQIYFRNIDLHMLTHHIATPEFVRRSMLRRYLYLLRGDLLSSAVIAADLVLLLLLSGLQMPAATVAGLTAVCILFLIFWETYECIVYYLIQPYSVDMTAKSPVFTALGYLEGIFQLLVLFVRKDLTAALPWICAVCIATVALFFVSRRYAPKTFHLR